MRGAVFAWIEIAVRAFVANAWVCLLVAGFDLAEEAEVVEVAQCFAEAVLDSAFVHHEAVEGLFGCEVL